MESRLNEDTEAWHCHVCAKKIKPIQCEETIFCGECSSEFVEKITNEDNPAEFRMITDDASTQSSCRGTSEPCSCGSFHSKGNISQSSSPLVSLESNSNEYTIVQTNLSSSTDNILGNNRISNESSISPLNLVSVNSIPNASAEPLNQNLSSTNTNQQDTNIESILQAMQSVASALQGINQTLASSATQSNGSPSNANPPLTQSPGSLFNSIGNLIHSDFGSVAVNRFFTNVTGVRSFNPGDYVWGRNFEDTLNYLFNSGGKPGNPPASQNMIESLKKISIEQNHLDQFMDCSICKEEFKMSETVNQLPCVHIFHSECIQKWLKIHNQCPVCRYELVEKEIESS